MKELSLKKFVVNEEGRFSITRPYESNQILLIIKNFIKDDLRDKIVTDSTACMGGDLINFSQECRMVNGIEIDPDNFSLLVKNCKNFECDNVNLFCQSYLDIYKKLKQNIIYMDPPWGGTSYKNKDMIFLKLGPYDLHVLIDLIKNANVAEYLFIKVPLNVSLFLVKYDQLATVYNKNKSASFQLILIDLKK